jgi:hypothetical protein
MSKLLPISIEEGWLAENPEESSFKSTQEHNLAGEDQREVRHLFTLLASNHHGQDAALFLFSLRRRAPSFG